ncbi:MAG: hypothetical protein LBT84_01555 [Spirochaetia bacterium]|jgi:glycerol-3-phosphate dehydrogenase (NAD(P)+)|nr:hypothetical protein [Spirochaetia bacterium]
MNAESIKAVSVIGAGSWGTTIGNVIANAHPAISVKIWAYEKNVVSSINHYHENTEFLPGVSLHPQVTATGSIKEACFNTDVIIIATPSKALPETAMKINRYVTEKTCLGFLTKGFCKIQDQVLTISQTIEKFIPKLRGRVVAISGPSHAEEVSKNFHTCLNVAGRYVPNRKLFCLILTAPFLQCRESDDIIGVEVGGTLKNPAAIAAGIIAMLPGCGDNLAGALIAEAMKEMIRLGRYFKAKDETMVDISGLGDLVATALSRHSRNRRFGQDIAGQIMEKGSKVRLMDRILLRFNPKAVIEKMSEKFNYLAEGAYAIEPLIEIANANDISVPVYRSLYEVLLNKKDPTLLIETIKNPVRYEEIYRQTKIHITEKKKGLEKVKGRLFRHFIIARVTGSLFEPGGVLTNENILLDKLKAYSALLNESPGNHREKLLLERIINAPSNKNIEPLLEMYLSSLADNYNGPAAGIFMLLISLGRFFADFPFKRKRMSIEGNISQLKSFCDLGNIIYVIGNRSLFDFIPALRSIRKIKMPLPRFMVTGDSLSGRFEASFIKFAGGFIFDDKKYRNPLYRGLFLAYLSTMIENGVPLLLYRSYDIMKIPGAFLQTIKNSMLNQSVEIMLSPISIARTNNDFPEAGLFPLRKHLKGGMIHRFSDFIFLSEFTKEDTSSNEILPALEALFKSDKPCYSHILMAKVFLKNKNFIPKKNLEPAARELIDSEGMTIQGRLKDSVNSGVAWLRKKKIIKKTGKHYAIDNMEEIKRLADLF